MNVHDPYLGDGHEEIRDLRVHSSFRCPASDPDYGLFRNIGSELFLMPHKPARPTTPTGAAAPAEAPNEAAPAPPALPPNMAGFSPEQIQLLQTMLAPLQAQLTQLAGRNQELEERQIGQADLQVRQAAWGPQDRDHQ